MVKIARILSLALLLSGAVAAETGHAQAIDFSCPRAGTIVKLPDGRTWTYQGADPSDPMACLVDDSARQLPSKLIYNNYTSASANTDVRAGMRDLFAGKSKVTFEYITINGGHPASWTDIWTRQGSVSLDIGGRKVEAIVIELDHEAVHGNFHGRYRRYFDPATGVWVKNEFTHLGGVSPFPILVNTTYQVVSITAP